MPAERDPAGGGMPVKLSRTELRSVSDLPMLRIVPRPGNGEFSQPARFVAIGKAMTVPIEPKLDNRPSLLSNVRRTVENRQAVGRYEA